jgi:hypothetical protein
MYFTKYLYLEIFKVEKTTARKAYFWKNFILIFFSQRIRDLNRKFETFVAFFSHRVGKIRYCICLSMKDYIFFTFFGILSETDIFGKS